MNVSDGGKQPFLRDTMWDGKPQKMVTSNGLQKGLKWVLEECSINVTKMNKEDMIKILEEMRDLKFQNTRVEELILELCSFTNFIVRLIQLNVCGVKQYTRAQCDYSFQGLEKTLGAALDSVDVTHCMAFHTHAYELLNAL